MSARVAALLLALAGCTTPPAAHVGPVTGSATLGDVTYSCSQAGLFAERGGSMRFVAGLPFRPFALAATQARGPALLIGGGDPGRSGELALLDPAGDLRARQRVADDLVYAVAIAPDGSQAAAALADGRVLLLPLPELRPARELQRHAGPVVAVAFRADGACVASGGQDGKVLLGAARGERPVQALVDHTAPVTCVAFAPAGGRLASGARDGRIRLHDPDGRLRHTWQRLGGPIATIAFAGERLEYTLAGRPELPPQHGSLPLPEGIADTRAR